MTTLEHEHGHGEQAEEHGHPGWKTYTLVGVILAIITALMFLFGQYPFPHHG